MRLRGSAGLFALGVAVLCAGDAQADLADVGGRYVGLDAGRELRLTLRVEEGRLRGVLTDPVRGEGVIDLPIEGDKATGIVELDGNRMFVYVEESRRGVGLGAVRVDARGQPVPNTIQAFDFALE
ncbi:MAG: hypothetical protein AAGJ92_10950 [Pseudomonadota bacterium]